MDRRNHRIVKSASADTDCSVIYSLVKKILELSKDRFYLSNGVKILSPGHPLSCYVLCTGHGLHLDCYLRCTEGDGTDDEGENWLVLLSLPTGDWLMMDVLPRPACC